jgi:hypothetical protein
VPIEVSQKGRFINQFTALTAAPKKEVSFRVRQLLVGGIGPLRNQPLTDSAVAAYLLGFICSPDHVRAAATVLRFSKFRLIGIGKGSTASAVKRVMAILPGLEESSLGKVLSRLVRLLAEDAPVVVHSLQAAWAPYDEAIVRIMPGGGEPPVELLFGERMAVETQIQLNDATVWPIKFVAALSGHVITELARPGRS